MSSSPANERRRSAPSFFNRLGFFRRHPKNRQVDYRERWPTVTTLVEQRSESCFFENQKPPKPAKIKALETASGSLQWLHHRLESFQDHLDHSIEVAEAKALKRASLPEKPTRPGQSKHPYDTGVETHVREHAEEDRGENSTGTIETHIIADPSPPQSDQKWRLPFTGAARGKKNRRHKAQSQRLALDASNEGNKEDDTASLVPQTQWKSVKGRQPSKYPDTKKRDRVDRIDRASSSENKYGSHTTNTPKPSPRPSLQKKRRIRDSAESRERPSSSKPSSPRTLTPSQLGDPSHPQMARRISGQMVQAVGLLSPQSRSRTTSANRGMEQAQQTRRKPSVASRAAATNHHSAASTPQEAQADPMGTESCSSSEKLPKSPKSGAFRHLLDVVKGGVPPSRAMSPLSMNGDGDEPEKPKVKQPE